MNERKLLGLIWDNRVFVRQIAATIWNWLRRKSQEGSEEPGILVLGPGGVGKSTLGKILSGEFDFLWDIPSQYSESLRTEHYPLKDRPSLEVWTPPGQEIRREQTWHDLLQDLSASKFRGLILVNSYGYHNHELGATISYKNHRLYNGDKDLFKKAFLEDRRQEELKVISELAPKITPPAGHKFWLLSLITKQDLWYEERPDALKFYSSGTYADEIAKITLRHGSRIFRHEIAYTSLVISNLTTGENEVLWKNTAGYDHAKHVQSLRDMLEKLEALRCWENDNERS